MKRKAAAIVQWKEGWCGISFSLRQKEISDLSLHTEKSLPELEKEFEEGSYGIGLENNAAYLFNLTFPFTEKRKIKLVIANELEERMPIGVDDMTVDFVESGKGTILAGAMGKSSSPNGSGSNKRVQITTVQSLAALHALRWFDRVRHRDFVFIHMNGSAMVVMAFKDDSLYRLRQFFHSAQSSSLHDVFTEITSDRNYAPRSYLMVADDGLGAEVKGYLERTFNIDIETPRLKETPGSDDAPEWLWAGVGTALLSVKPKGALDFTGQKRQYAFMSTKAGVYLSAGLASLGLLTYGLLYTDYHLKQRTLDFLGAEQTRIYRLSFPKSQPVKDPARVFRDKVRSMDQTPVAAAAKGAPLAVLDEISKKIGPDVDVKVNEFSSDDKEFTIAGTTISFASVEKIKKSIEGVAGVSQVDMQSLDLGADRQVKFKMRGRI